MPIAWTPRGSISIDRAIGGLPRFAGDTGLKGNERWCCEALNQERCGSKTSDSNGYRWFPRQRRRKRRESLIRQLLCHPGAARGDFRRFRASRPGYGSVKRTIECCGGWWEIE